MIIEKSANKHQEIRLDELAQSLPVEAFTPIQLNLDKPKSIWVATVEVELSQLEGKRTIAMGASQFCKNTGMRSPIGNL